MFQKLLVGFLLATLVSANNILADPETSIAVLILPAPQIDAGHYQPLLQRLQHYFSPVGVVKVVQMPNSYNYNYVPEKEIKDSLSQIKTTADGKSVILIGHSWGGHAIQNMLHKHMDGKIGDWAVMGSALLGSSIQRDLIQIMKDGSSYIDISPHAPVQIIGAELDGLNRASRLAESYWHTRININENQKSLFETLIIRGMNHAQFANGAQPVYIYNNDHMNETKTESNLDVVALVIAQRYVNGLTYFEDSMQNDTRDFLMPLVDAMILEGNYNLKPPCYSSDMVNPDSPTFTAGSPFISNVAHNTMASDSTFKNKNVKMVNHDQFHRASTVVPVHHPVINGSCTLTDKECTFTTYSITENYYIKNNDFTTLDRFQVAAWDMRAKLKSRQALRIASGETDADFHKYDETGENCAEINQKAWDWAIANADKTVKERYQRHGRDLLIVRDRNTINGGLWIYAWMTYTDTKTSIIASSYAYRMGESFPIKAFAGDHYCKILSPFKAMEWIYVESLYANPVKSTNLLDVLTFDTFKFNKWTYDGFLQ